MFNIGSGEMIVIFLLALIVLGPERLPKAMGQVGKYVAQMRKLSSGFQDEIKRAMDPLEAPFRPGEQTLSGPVPSATDEVRVVSTEKAPETPEAAPADDPADAPEPDPSHAPDASAEAPEDADATPGTGTVFPLRPLAEEADGGDGDRAAG